MASQVNKHGCACCDPANPPELTFEKRWLEGDVCGFRKEDGSDCKIYKEEALTVSANFTVTEYWPGSDPPEVTEIRTVAINIVFADTHTTLFDGDDSDGGNYDCDIECVVTGSASETITQYWATGVKDEEIRNTWTPKDPNDDCKTVFKQDFEQWEKDFDPNRTPPYIQGASLGSQTLTTGDQVKNLFLQQWGADSTVGEEVVHSDGVADPITNTELRADLDGKIDLLGWVADEAEDHFAEYVAVELDVPDPETSPCEARYVLLKEMRYYWTVPADWGSSYYRVEWDEVFFPEGWDEPGGDTPTVTAKSWEWTGGSKDGPFSGAVKVPTGSKGIVELRNARYSLSPVGLSLPIPGFNTYEP